MKKNNIPAVLLLLILVGFSSPTKSNEYTVSSCSKQTQIQSISNSPTRVAEAVVSSLDDSPITLLLSF